MGSNSGIMKFMSAWLALATGAYCASQPATPCEGLAGLALTDAKIVSAATISSGSFTPSDGKPIDKLPPLCRVAGILQPTADSHIEFEVWMPASKWNGKFQGVGNGGFAGSISYGWGGLATAVTAGYAAGATDTGHKGTSIDATWALHHPEKIVDFGHRAIHEMTVQSKAIVKAYYGEAPHKSYFAGCSNGGRQALMEAQRYPADYDGIISGAPAYDWTGIMAGFMWNLQALASPGAFIPPSKLKAVESGILASCDVHDGVADGVLEDPRKCAFDPQALVCKGAESDSCLTAPQASALARIYAGPRDKKGAQISAGFERGGETGNGGWGLWITGMAPAKSLQAMFATQFLANMVFSDAAYDYKMFDLDRDLKIAYHKMAKIMNATEPDLSAFKKRGGKLILFHGWNDAALPPANTIRYYGAVKDAMGASARDSFVRLYMLPGVQHCAGGPGPSYCGGLGAAQGDRTHDLSAALEHWVEDGDAPGPMVAVKFAKEMDPGSEVVRSRPVCPYPQAAVYKGSGSTDDASNFECKPPR